MDLLTASDLSAMRLTAAEALDSLAVVQTESFVSDGRGGGTASWTAAGTVACRLAPYAQSSGEVVEGEQVMEDAEVLITTPAETEIDRKARVVVDKTTFTVVALRRRSQELTRRFAAKEIE
jgi:head-tail adaptor